MNDQIKHPIVPSKIKGHDLMAFTTWAKVKAVDADGLRLIVTDINGKEVSVKGKDLIDTALSADQFQEEKKVSKTAAVDILTAARNTPITVCFLKKDESVRVLRGRYVSHETHFGRSIMEDLDLEKERIREVDHRTLQWLIVDGVKYIVK